MSHTCLFIFACLSLSTSTGLRFDGVKDRTTFSINDAYWEAPPVPYTTQTSGTCVNTLTEDECAAVAVAISAPGGNVNPTCCSQSDCAPVGCYQYFSNNVNDQKVYYNDDKIGTCSSSRRCLCKAATPAHSHGDPHMVNIKGEHFDLQKHGLHTLLKIPRFADAPNTLLNVKVLVRNTKSCKGPFIKQVNISGKWAEKEASGRKYWFFDAQDTQAKEKFKDKTVFVRPGGVVVRIRFHTLPSGFCYINLHMQHLDRVPLEEVGGILGLDDYEYATQKKCTPVQSLMHLVGETSAVNEEAEEVDFDEAHSVGVIASANLA